MTSLNEFSALQDRVAALEQDLALANEKIHKLQDSEHCLEDEVLKLKVKYDTFSGITEIAVKELYDILADKFIKIQETADKKHYVIKDVGAENFDPGIYMIHIERGLLLTYSMDSNWYWKTRVKHLTEDWSSQYGTRYYDFKGERVSDVMKFFEPWLQDKTR